VLPEKPHGFNHDGGLQRTEMPAANCAGILPLGRILSFRDTHQAANMLQSVIVTNYSLHARIYHYKRLVNPESQNQWHKTRVLLRNRRIMLYFDLA
jgi:hypothetical protein